MGSNKKKFQLKMPSPNIIEAAVQTINCSAVYTSQLKKSIKAEESLNKLPWQSCENPSWT